MDELLQVGVIASTHGIKGEVNVFPTTNDAKRFNTLKKVILDTGKEKRELEIQGVKYFKKFVILKFKEFDNINDVEVYKGKSLYVTREWAVKCKKDEYFVADLIDLAVVDEEDKEFGTLIDVLETGANDVYVIKMNDGKEVLVPAIKQCILAVDMAERKIKIHLMDGLLD